MRNRKQGDGPRLPAGWTRRVRAALLHVLSLAQFAVARTRGWAADRLDELLWLHVENARLRQEVALLREEIRIKGARMAQIPASRRPHYPPTERMSILELKAVRGWSLEQTARAFLIAAATVAAWLGRLNEEGPKALVQLHEPVNKFPTFVATVVRRLKTLCPMLGKRKIAQVLARAGLHLGRTTVDRLLKPKPTRELASVAPDHLPRETKRTVTANYSDHVWHVHLTAVPISRGCWTAWLPFSLPQLWPFCWWIAVVVDHYSRRIQGVAAFRRQPNSEAVRAFLGRTIQRVKASPKHLICDKGSQFFCEGFEVWCRRPEIKPRFGAVGQHGSIAIVERRSLPSKPYSRTCRSCQSDKRRLPPNSGKSSHGTTNTARTRRLVAARPTKSAKTGGPQIAPQDSSCVPVGPEDRRAPSRGHWCAASPARGLNWTSSFNPAESTCRSFA